MSLGITNAEYLEVLGDIGVTVSYYAATRVVDPIYGSETVSLASPVSKTWIFWKRGSKIDLAKFGVLEMGDAYVIIPVSDNINYGDRVSYSGETYEYTPECFNSNRWADGGNIFKYFTLKKVA